MNLLHNFHNPCNFHHSLHWCIFNNMVHPHIIIQLCESIWTMNFLNNGSVAEGVLWNPLQGLQTSLLLIFFAWGYLKDQVHSKKPQKLEELWMAREQEV